MFSIFSIALGVVIIMCAYTSYQLSKTRQQIADIFVNQELSWSKVHQSEIESLQFLMRVGHFNQVTGQCVLSALRPHIVILMQQAADNEAYETASQCQKLLKEMDKLIAAEE